MGTFTRENTEIAVDIEGYGEQHRADGRRDGDRTRTVDRRPRHDRDVRRATRRCLPGAPLWLRPRRLSDGALHRRLLRDADAGDAYYLKPGHNVHIDQDAEFVEFTRADDAPGINRLRA